MASENLVTWMDKAAGFSAIRQARSMVVAASIDGIEFKVSIMQGDIAKLVAGVERVERPSLRVQVEGEGLQRGPMDGS